MENNYISLLREQIKLTLPHAEILDDSSREKIIITDYPIKGIKIQLSSSILILFNELNIDFIALKTYFEPRLKYDECTIYYNSLSSSNINITSKKVFQRNNTGDFEKAMWTYNVFLYITRQIKILGEELN